MSGQQDPLDYVSASIHLLTEVTALIRDVKEHAFRTSSWWICSMSHFHHLSFAAAG